MRQYVAYLSRCKSLINKYNPDGGTLGPPGLPVYLYTQPLEILFFKLFSVFELFFSTLPNKKPQWRGLRAVPNKDWAVPNKDCAVIKGY